MIDEHTVYCDHCKKPISAAQVSYETGGSNRISTSSGIALPFICRRCGGSFCGNCRLPENHDCAGLKPPSEYELIMPLELPIPEP